jgi:hypothetical protein
MDKQELLELNRFMGRASKATYASGGGKVKPWREGFNELEYKDGDWYYRDSYAGFLRSWGQEVIWYKDKPVWTCSYGGGMTDENMDVEFANETFSFLKKVFMAGDKENMFQPRGPEDYQDNEWKYHSELNGDISKFSGNEFITKKDQVVFTHNFVGGLVIDRNA